jgi:sulfite reductase beta subunit-like hemoprotein
MNKKNPVGRPKKHNETQSKTMRLPIHLIEKINKDKQDGESFTDALIRLVSIGLLL